MKPSFGALLVIPQRMLITLVKAYRLLLSPWLGSACRFEPTCSVYSLQALQQYGAVGGSYLTLRRLGRCHPWCEGGCDPVPVALNFLFFTACLCRRFLNLLKRRRHE